MDTLRSMKGTLLRSEVAAPLKTRPIRATMLCLLDTQFCQEAPTGAETKGAPNCCHGWCWVRRFPPRGPFDRTKGQHDCRRQFLHQEERECDAPLREPQVRTH